MKKKIIVLTLIAIFVAQMQAQEEITYTMPRLHIGIEAGVNPLFGTINPQPNIRENRYYYLDNNYDYYCGFMYSQTEVTSFSLGVKPEYLIHKRLALATGLRFSFCKPFLHSDRDYFLWKVSETETSANYVKIRNLSQKNFYLEIPFELKLFPREKDYAVRHYFVFGTAFNFLISSSSSVEFQNPRMEKYTSEVLKHIGAPNIFQCSGYAGIGVKFGKMKYPFGNLEIHFPVITVGRVKKGSFIDTVSGVIAMRFLTTFNIPVVKKHQLTYTVID